MSLGAAIRVVEYIAAEYEPHKQKMENKRHHNSLLIIFLFKPLKLLINVKNEKLISLLLDLIFNSNKAFFETGDYV